MNCTVCNGSNYREWGCANGFVVKQCLGCGLGVTSPFPDAATLEKVNQETYSLEQRIEIYLARKRYFVDRYRRQLDNIGKFKNNGRLLDLGCNIGMFLVEARSAGYDVVGVELNRECADYARNSAGLEVSNEYLERTCFPAESFDVVTMYDVLEHIPDMTAMLAEIRRILKPGGLVVVQSPNLDSLMASAAGSSWSWLSPPDHLYHFTPGSLAELLAQNSFSLQELITWEPADDFSVDVMQSILGNSLPSRALRKFLRLSGMAGLSVSLLQPFWWRRGKGALIEAYAVKAGAATEGR